MEYTHINKWTKTSYLTKKCWHLRPNDLISVSRTSSRPQRPHSVLGISYRPEGPHPGLLLTLKVSYKPQRFHSISRNSFRPKRSHISLKGFTRPWQPQWLHLNFKSLISVWHIPKTRTTLCFVASFMEGDYSHFVPVRIQSPLPTLYSGKQRLGGYCGGRNYCGLSHIS